MQDTVPQTSFISDGDKKDKQFAAWCRRRFGLADQQMRLHNHRTNLTWHLTRPLPSATGSTRNVIGFGDLDDDDLIRIAGGLFAGWSFDAFFSQGQHYVHVTCDDIEYPYWDEVTSRRNS